MANREYYSEVIDEMRKAQGKLTNALYSDLDRLASAESNSAKVKAQQAYERGVNEAFDVIVALFEMHPLDLQEYLKTYGLDDMKQFLKSGNRVERVKQVQHTVRVIRLNEPQVGDEVEYRDARCIVAEKRNGGEVVLFYPITMTFTSGHSTECNKTGRHFNITEIVKAIEEMKK